MLHKGIAFFAAAAIAMAAHTAVLQLDVTILQGEADAPAVAKKGASSEVMFLVLDHSGSMNETDGRANSRWEAVLAKDGKDLKPW